MKLYFSPGACSLSPHIALREAGLPFSLVRVDLRTHRTADGADFYAVNPKGYVPALELDDGQLLTEGPAIVQYVADQAPGKQLAPENGTLARYRLQEWLTFIGTELHKAFSPLFNSATSEDTKKASIERLTKRFDYVDQQLQGKSFLLGEHFSVADGYLFVTLKWAQRLLPAVHEKKNLAAFFARVSERPGVKAALEAEAAASGK